MESNKVLMKWANKQVEEAKKFFKEHGHIIPTFFMKTDQKCYVFVLGSEGPPIEHKVMVEQIKKYIKNLRANGHKPRAGLLVCEMLYFKDDDIEMSKKYRDMPLPLVPGVKSGVVFQLDLISNKKYLLVDIKGRELKNVQDWDNINSDDNPYMGLLNDFVPGYT